MFWTSLTIVHGQHSISFYTNQTYSCDSLDVQVVNSSFIDDNLYNGTVFYEWYINGSFVSSTDTSFYYRLYPGKHDIELKAFDETSSFIGDYYLTVEVGSVPAAFESGKGWEVCPGEDVQFYYHVTNDMDYSSSWDFGDGNTSSGNWTHHVYQNPGSYLVTLIINGPCGGDTLTQQITVTETAVPKVKVFSNMGTTFCPGDVINMHIEGKYKSYQWQFDDEIFSYSKEAARVFNSNGSYDIIAKATNVCGVTSSDTITFNIGDDIPAYAYFDYHTEGSMCPGMPVLLKSHSTGKIQWIVDEMVQGNSTQYMFVPEAPGDYKIDLIVENGCGSLDTASKNIFVDYTYETVMEEVRFRFEQKEDESMDTLFVCPGETFRLRNETHASELNYFWIIDENDTIESHDLEYSLNSAGFHSIYLLAVNQCKGSMSSIPKTIVVDNNLQPDVDLKAGPFILCPGDTVYFFDDNLRDEIKYSYHIDFGDNSEETGITSYTNGNLHTLANHAYETEGSYNYVFSATNTCGVTTSQEGSIEVNENPETPPFYYVRNSTQSEEDKPAHDWSVKRGDFDFEVKVPVVWPDWYNELDSTFFVYFWYGGVSLEDDPGMPDGYVELQSEKIASGDTITGYVPFSAMDRTVGFIVGWYCNSDNSLLHEPDHIAMPMNGQSMIEEVNIEAGGSLDITSLTSGIPVTFMDWSGVCKGEGVDGEWLADKGDGKVLLLEFWEDDFGNRQFSFHQGTVENNHEYLISEGQYYLNGADSIELNSSQGECFGIGIYTYEVLDNTLTFTVLQDDCDNRNTAISTYQFSRYEDKGENHAACPGDPVMFTVAGGKTYEWHFSDGTINNGATVFHKCDNPGEYNEYVVATNACGTTDTIYTKVYISTGNLPYAGFSVDRYQAMTGEKMQFYLHEQDNWQPNIQYFWDFGDGSGSILPFPEHSYSEPGDYIVRLKAVNGCGFSTWEQHVRIDGDYSACEISADFIYDIAGNGAAFFDQTFNGAPTSYYWEFGDQTSSKSPNPSHSYSEEGLYLVKLRVHDSITGCYDEIVKEVIIGNAECLTDFDYSIVGKDSVHFSDNSNGIKTQWTWEFGDNEMSSKQFPLHVYPAGGFYKVTLSTVDENGCYSSQTKEILLESVDANDCYVSFVPEVNGLEVKLQASVSPNITSGYWIMGDGTTKYEQEVVYSYQKPGEYKICAVVYDSLNNCQSKACKIVRVGEIDCYADFNYVFKDNGAVDFVNRSMGGNFRSAWDFGDGKVSGFTNPMHLFKQPGEYSVKLSIHNDTLQCFAETEKQVIVESNSEQASCKPEMSYFHKSGTMSFRFDEISGRKYTNYYWTFGDNSYSTEKSPEHTFETTGIYEVCLNTRNTETGCSDRVCELITVTDETNTVVPVMADFSVFPVLGSRAVLFKDNSSGKVSSRYWTFGDGNMTSDSVRVTHLYKNSGTYEVCLVAVDEENDLVNKKCKKVLAGSKDCDMVASFNYDVDPESRRVNFKNKSVGSYNKVSWYFDDGLGAYENNPMHVFENPGYYLVSLTVRDTMSGCQAKDYEMIQIGSTGCRAGFDYEVDPDSLIVRFKNKSKGQNNKYYWMFGDKSVSVDVHPVKKYKKPGNYSVALSVSDASGTCTDMKRINIQVGEVECDAGFEMHVDSVQNTAYFQNTSMGEATKFNWHFGDGFESKKENPVHQYPNSGYYTVRLIVANDDRSCLDREQKTILIGHRGRDCEADFYWNVDEETKETRYISTSFGEGLSYKWNFGDGDSSDIQTPVHTYELSGYYDVCLTVENNHGIVNTTCKTVPVSVIDTLHCYADFVYEVDSVSRSVKFIDLSSGEPDKWRWEFGDSTGITNDPYPQHGYAEPGYYMVRLVVANSNSGCVDAHYELINVADKADGIKASFGYVIDSLSLKSSGKPVDFVGIATGKPSQFAWKFGDGNSNYSTLTPTNVYTQNGLFTATFSVSDPITGAFNSFSSDILIQFLSETESILTENLDVLIYPNPYKDRATLHLNIVKRTRVSIELIDELGRLVKTILDDKLTSGIHHLEWDASELRQGFYMIRILTEEGDQKIIRTVKQ